MALTNKGLLIVLSGPSGAGKDTVLEELRKRDLNMKQSISMTTRAMRPGEKDGVDYYFTNVEAFEKKIGEGYFLEYVKYGDNYYGTPKKAIEELIEQGYNVFLKIEVEGAGNVRKAFPDAVCVFIVPPSIKALEERLRGRGTETEDSYRKRLEIAKNELLRAKEYNYIVINDTVSECADRVCAVINAEYSRCSRMIDIINEMNK